MWTSLISSSGSIFSDPFVSNEFAAERVAFLLTLGFLENKEIQLLNTLLAQLNQNNQWVQLDHLIHDHQIETLAFHRVIQLNLNPDKIPQEIFLRWKKRAQEVDQTQQLRLKSALPVLDFFSENDIPWILLKGQSLAEEVYGISAYKQMNDIDILVQPANLTKIFNFLKYLKYVSVMQLSEENPRGQEKYSHHWPPFLSQDFSCIWGIYWSLVSPVKKYHLDLESIWKRAQITNFAGRKVLRLQAEDILHHLCLHLNLYKSGLKEVQDIYNLVRHFDRTEKSFNWLLFAEQIHHTGSYDEVYHAFRTAYAYSGLSSLDEFAKTLEDKISNRMKNFVLKKCLSPQRLLQSRSTYSSRIEKNYAFFTITESPLEKLYFLLKMWTLLLLPPMSELLKISYSESKPSLLRKIKLRMMAPSLASQQFIHDLGLPIHIFLILRHHVVLLRCFFRRLNFKNNKPKEIKDILKSFGISDPKQLPDF